LSPSSFGFAALQFDIEEEDDDNCCHLLRGFVIRKCRPSPFFYGFVTKKVTAALSSPSSMVAIYLFIYFFCCCCCLCFSSLKLTIDNNWWFLV
jgi:hypothetical protein